MNNIEDFKTVSDALAAQASDAGQKIQGENLGRAAAAQRPLRGC